MQNINKVTHDILNDDLRRQIKTGISSKRYPNIDNVSDTSISVKLLKAYLLNNCKKNYTRFRCHNYVSQ